MIGIEGTDDDGHAYMVLADTSPQEIYATGIALPATYGETVYGTPRIISYLMASDGEPVALTPTGPTVPLAADDPRSIVAWLMDNTSNVRVVTQNDPIPAQLPEGDQPVC